VSYRPRHFELYELVPRDVFEARGLAAWELLDDRALVTLDALREKFGACVVNNWRDGGPYHESGLRSFDTATGARYSQHRFGRAVDCKFSGATPREVFDYVVAHAAEFPLLTTLEDVNDTPTWLHFDVRNNAGSGVRIVKP
jgi:hypothetical protein